MCLVFIEIEEILENIRALPESDRKKLLQELLDKEALEESPEAQVTRGELLNNKMGHCPHCGHSRYVRFGKDKGAQRYKCKSCKRSFTEYTGTWMAGLHKKDKINGYLTLMLQEKSLDKIVAELKINKKTAFDWRHKILSSLGGSSEDDFTGITESDETFFLSSEKGRKDIPREPRKRGGASSKRGINRDHVTVIVTKGRKSSLGLTVATMGRIKKTDIERAIGNRIKRDKAILCSDAHVSYKGFAMDNHLEHHVLKGL